jgi:hypothetical protein
MVPSVTGQDGGIGAHEAADYAKRLLDLADGYAGGLASSTVLLPDVRLIVRQPPTALARAISDSFIRADASDGSQHTLSLTILHADLPGVPHPRRWTNEAYAPHQVAEAALKEGLHVNLHADICFWQAMSLNRGTGVQLMKAANGFPPWEPGAPLRVFLHWFYASIGKRLVHGGTIGHDGRGALLAGAGGAGKSGTVVAALMAGMDSVGDDYVIVDPADKPVAQPLYKTLKQDPAGSKRLGLDVILGERPTNWQGKHQFLIDEVSSRPIPARLPLDMILLPRTGASRTRVEPVAPREVMMALAPSALYQMPGERESGFRFFAMLAKRLPGYILHLGPEPREVADQIRRILSDERT